MSFGCSTTIHNVRAQDMINEPPPRELTEDELWKIYVSDNLLIPDKSDIDYIVAEMYSSPWGFADIPPFVVSEQFHGEILERFQPFSEDPLPKVKWNEIGSLRIVRKNGRSVRISWFSCAGKAGLPFSLRGVRCTRTSPPDQDVRDEASGLDVLLRKVYFEQTGNETRIFSRN
jgi:hypothetical protein